MGQPRAIGARGANVYDASHHRQDVSKDQHVPLRAFEAGLIAPRLGIIGGYMLFMFLVLLFSCLSVFFSICLSIYLPTYLPIYLSIYLLIYDSIYSCVYVHIHVLVYLNKYKYIFWSVPHI